MININVKKNEKVAFVSSIIVGFISYGYIITHNFLTYDSMWNIYSDQNMISSGRPFLMYACKISSDYNLPWFNGLLAIFYLALNAIMLVKCFGTEREITSVLIGALVASFPSVTSTFAYSFTVDGYMLAILLATLAVWISSKYRFGYIMSIFILGISIGIYQAYFSYAIVLCILILVCDILRGNKLKDILIKAAKFVGMGAGGYLFYVIALKVMLKLQDVELSGYQGTDSVTSLNLSVLPTGLKTAFWSFIDFARWANVLTTTVPMKIAFIGMVCICAFEIIYILIKKKIYRSIPSLVILVALLLALPFGATMVSIISPNTYIHLLIRMPWALLFVFTVVVAEDIYSYSGFDRNSMISKVVLVGKAFCFVMVFEFALVANIVGFNMNERYEKTYATCVRIVDRLEQTEGYETGMPVAILGGFPNEDNYPHTDITKDDLSGYFGVDGELCVNSTGKYAEFMKHYLNVTITVADADRELELAETDAFAKMSNFPAKDSIRCVDGVWIVRING